MKIFFSLLAWSLASDIVPSVVGDLDPQQEERSDLEEYVTISSDGVASRWLETTIEDKWDLLNLNETFLAAFANETDDAELRQTNLDDDGPSLIVGGQQAARGAYPYFVDIFGADPTGGICGGSLIAPRVVLSAQHCNKDANDEITFAPTFVGKQVRVGAFDASGTADGSRLVTVVEQRSHPQFRRPAGGGSQNDFLLLRLAEEVNIENVSPKLRLSNLDSDISPGTPLTAIGLGRLMAEGPAATTLQEVIVRAVSDLDCLEDWASTLLSPYPPLTVCVLGESVGQGLCQVRPLIAHSDLKATHYFFVFHSNACLFLYKFFLCQKTGRFRWTRGLCRWGHSLPDWYHFLRSTMCYRYTRCPGTNSWK
jgi:hypothetical protein